VIVPCVVPLPSAVSSTKSVLSTAKNTNVPFLRKGGTYTPSNFSAFSTTALAIAVSGHVIRKSSVNGEVVLTSYSWFHVECLVPNRQLSDFPGDVVS